MSNAMQQRLDRLDARRSLAPLLVMGAVLLSVLALAGHQITDVTRILQGRRAQSGGGDAGNGGVGAEMQTYVADLEVEDSFVGWGLKLNHFGKSYEHGVSTHATPHATNPAFATFKIPDAAKTRGRPVLFSAVVGVNDNNNRAGMAGSELMDEVPLTQCPTNALSNPSEDSAVDVDVSQHSSITLQVEAAGNNHCTHAVWVDPTLRYYV
eukprot:gene8779-1275_t